LRDLIRQPAAAHELLEFATQVVIDEARLYQSIGVHGLIVCDPSASGDLISPSQYSEFAAPYTKKVSEAIEELGVPQIMHVCGNTSKILPLIKELAPAGFSFDTSVDVATVKAAVGDSVCLIGNVDPTETLLLGSPDKVARDTELCIEKGAAGGGYVGGAGCDLGLETPLQNVQAMIEACVRSTY
jgi:uroporphyrinogen decarboxylase